MTADGGPSAAWSLRRRVTRSILAVLTLLVVLVALVSVALWNTKQTGDEVVDRWDPAALSTQAAMAALVNQETGVRGYALGRQDRFLDPYTRALTAEDDAVAELRDLLRGEDDLLDLLDGFTAASDAWHDDVADPVIAQVQADGPGAVRALSTAPSRESFDAVREAAAELEAGVEERRSTNIDARARAFTLVWASIAVGLLVLLVAALLLWRGLQRAVLAPVDDLADQTRRVAGGDLRHHIEPVGPAEILHLGRDVDRMREMLAAELARVERSRERLERRGAELARSNADLEQFAYVASHDLSEPLRKVTNFCQLLERQYGDQLDDKARQYIAFMVDGAKRMQVLITDLLAFSRVGRTTDDFVDVDLDRALTQALATLEDAVATAGAVVERTPLPTVPGDATLLTALLQNLVGNAVKYRSEDRPQRIRVSAERDGDAWRLTVDDEGIGIDAQYADRIFAIFQRLHLRDQYGGTGIGLALCRKIVEFHGGRIWLAEKSGPGARFHVTLPAERAPAESLDADEPSTLAVP